jgi:hypothetical protein
MSDLALARQHVIDGEERVARQIDLVNHLRSHGYSTAEAVRLLTAMWDTLQMMKDHLARLEAEAKPLPRPAKWP